MQSIAHADRIFHAAGRSLFYQNCFWVCDSRTEAFLRAGYLLKAFYEREHDHYDLGPGLIPAQDCFKRGTTFNPTYELAYWYWGLRTAQEWRRRLGIKPKKEWDVVLQKLEALPERSGVYLATESTPDCYDADSNYTIDHPAVLAALSTLPRSLPLR